MKGTAALVAATAWVVACGGVRGPAGAADPAAAGVANPATPACDTLLPINGTELFVHRVGTGEAREALVVVHGGPVLDHGYMLGPLRPLADSHELVFYDQRLSGRSAGVVDSASVRLDTFVADIEALRVALGLDRIHLLGHSWGGLLALKYALDHPSRLRSLILVSPMAPSAELWQEEEAALAASMVPADTAGMGAIRESEAFRQGDPSAIERLLQLSFRSQLHDPSVADSLRFRIGDDYMARSRQFGHMLPDLLTFDLVDRLPTLDVPTLVVYGGHEVSADAGAALFRRMLPRGTVDVLPDAGHFAFLERPEAFRRAVRAFMRTAHP